MSDYVHQQNCTTCDKPGWLIGGRFYNILKININNKKGDHSIVLEFKIHKCKEAEG